MFVAMIQHPDFSQFDLSSLRTGIMAGAPCPIEVMKRCVAEMHLSEVTIAYGMTETSPVSFQTSADDPLERRVSTVGRIHPHVECKVVDETGKTVAPGVQGEICTRGYSVMKGYWDEPERTAEAIDSDGWMHTGDLGVIDSEGYCNITGRVKDMLIRGGENVYPREIEEFLLTNPAIQQAQVFGVPDERLGEEVGAAIFAREGVKLDAQRLRESCAQHLAAYKIPKYIWLVDDPLPRNANGKFVKKVLRDSLKIADAQ